MINKVAIVVPCLNEVAYLDRLIESVLSQDLEGISLRLLIVDGMSTDGSRALIKKWEIRDARVTLCDNKARVTPVALNIGIAQSKSETVIILGAHAEVARDFTRKNLETLALHPDAGCVGGSIENIYESNTARIIGLAVSSPFGVGNARFRTGGSEGEVDTVAFGAYRNKVFEKIGLFDQRLVRNQDDEFNYRLLKSGYKIWFNPEIRSRYYVRGTFDKLARQYRQYGYWKVYVNRLHGTITTVRQLVPFFFVSSMLALLLLSLVFPFSLFFFAVGASLWSVAAAYFAHRKKEKKGDFLAIMRCFFILHFYYGWGFGQGIVAFIVLRKTPDVQNPNLTR